MKRSRKSNSIRKKSFPGFFHPGREPQGHRSEAPRRPGRQPAGQRPSVDGRFLDAAFFGGGCPLNSIVRLDHPLKEIFLVESELTPVFNLQPGPNEPASSPSASLIASIFIHGSIRTGEDYGTTLTIPNTSQAAPPHRQLPDSSGECPAVRVRNRISGEPYGAPARPFVSNPTSCTGPGLFNLRLNFWQEPSDHHEASFLTHNSAEEPVGAGRLRQTELRTVAQPAVGTAQRGSADRPERQGAPPPAQRRPQRADHCAPEEVGRQAAPGGRGQPGRGERPRRLQRGAVRPRQQQPGELPERLADRPGRNRQPAARTSR